MSKKQLHKELRKRFNEEVFKRDRHKCIICGSTEKLDAHHITDRKEMPNGGYVLSNGATLCEIHHWSAEQFHINGGKAWLKGFHPSELYLLINSSYEQAHEDSIKSGT